MKKIILITALIIMISGVSAQEKEEVILDSLNIGFPAKLPISHYSEFSRFQIGFNSQFNFKIINTDHFRILLRLDGTYNFSASSRIDHLVELSATLGIGWEFPIGDSGFTVTPQLSGGIVTHVLKGDFYLNGNPSTSLFANQLYRFQLELAYTLKNKRNKKSSVGFYLSPSFEVFSGKQYWGYLAGGSIGIRIQFKENINEE